MEEILPFLNGRLKGNSWEDLCNSAYRMRYKNEHYTEIPANRGGDGGIEGFTSTGIVIQCYGPENVYSNKDLYEHQRDKMSKDLNKLQSKNYKKRLEKFGVPLIHEWHFVIPMYKDSRILEHAEIKRKEILEAKAANPLDYDHIADDFKIIIKCADDFRLEFSRIIRGRVTDNKLNIIVHSNEVNDWKECDSEKTKNIERKVRAIVGDLNEENVKVIVQQYAKSYIEGIEILNKLKLSYPEIYDELYSLIESYKTDVLIKTNMNCDRSLNCKIFNDILDKFEDKLRTEFECFDETFISRLKHGMISAWLADCSMQFRG